MPNEEEQVNNAFSKAAVWVIIALVLFTVFRQFETRQGRVGDIPYSQFMKEAENGQVDSVQIDGRAVRGEQIKPMRVFHASITYLTLLFVAIAIDPPRVLLLIFAPYALSGPVQALWRRLRRTPPETPPSPNGAP